MSDPRLVERLREIVPREEPRYAEETALEAADYIERLEAERNHYRDHGRPGTPAFEDCEAAECIDALASTGG